MADEKFIKFMQGFKELPKTERRNAIRNLSREQKGQFNEMNKKYGSYLKDQRTLEKRKTATKGKGGGSAGGDDPTFPIFNMMKRPDLPEGKKAGGKITKLSGGKKVRGVGIAKKGVRKCKMR